MQLSISNFVDLVHMPTTADFSAEKEIKALQEIILKL
jgi:hypothetical protein